MSRCAVIAGGGSGSQVYPGLAVTEELLRSWGIDLKAAWARARADELLAAGDADGRAT